MPRKSELKKSRHHIMIFDEDWDFLENNFGANSKAPIGISHAIAVILHAKVQELRNKAAAEFERQMAAAAEEE